MRADKGNMEDMKEEIIIKADLEDKDAVNLVIIEVHLAMVLQLIDKESIVISLENKERTIIIKEKIIIRKMIITKEETLNIEVIMEEAESIHDTNSIENQIII